MNGRVFFSDGTTKAASSEVVHEALAGKSFFWLDLSDMSTDAETAALFRDAFGFHPLAIEDVQHFGQRPKIDDYEDVVYIVVYGAIDHSKTFELHCFYSGTYLVTVHRGPFAPLEVIREHLALWRHENGLEPAMILYRVIDAAVDSFFPILDDFDDGVDDLEDAILVRPTDEQLGKIFAMKRSLVSFRKVVTPQRDLVAAIMSGEQEIPGITDEAERYFRDVYDHLIRLNDLVDGYRDLLSSVLDTHLSTVSNRLNVVMKQLTVIATVLLPLSFLTGFFGQNFNWLTSRIGGAAAFFGIGIGLELFAVVGLLSVFVRRGWL